MLADAIEFPTTADDWIQTVIIGGALSALGFLILPAIVVQGYTVRVARAAARGETAPSFTDWGELLVDGVKLLVLQLVAAVAVLVPLAVVLGVVGTAAGLSGSRTLGGIAVLIAVLLIGLLGLVLGYFLPAAVANFAIEDSLAAAFDLRTVGDGALSADYATAWLLAVLIGFVGGLVGGALSVILVGFLLVFYTQVVTYYLFGRGFVAGLGVDATPGGAGTPAVGRRDGTRQTALGETGNAERGTARPGGRPGDASLAGGDAPDAATSGADASADDGRGEDAADPDADDDGAETNAADAGDADPDERGSDGTGTR